MKLSSYVFHFVGVGGVGMSGLAELLHNMGAKVSGSDVATSAIVQRLKTIGIKVSIGHKSENVPEDANCLVYSSAVNWSNPEMRVARDKKIPVIRRAEVLSEIMRLKRGIAIGGSHGKTTTTSLLATVLIQAGIDPTVVVGGRLDLIKSTAKLGGGEWLVAEADESDGSFLSLVPEVAVITNIDNDHMDHYGNLENLKKTFFDFGLKVPFYGFVVACGDEKAVREAFAEFPKRIIFYGFNSDNDFVLKREKGGYQVFQGSDRMGSFFPQMPGDHNALNALAAIIVSTQLGVKFEVAAKGIEEFQGVDRRFQIKGEVDGCKVYDDYGHHPTEIKAVLKAVRDRYPDKRVVLAFQPHRFSRTKLCWSDFLSAFQDCDELLLTNIYPAGEEPIEGITSENLFKEIQLKAKKFYPMLSAQNLKENIRNGDILLTMGAGPIWKTAEELVNEYGKN